MARRYDTRTITFSPEGRLYQVEYALEAISMAGTCVGVLSKEGVVLISEKRVSSKLLEESNVSEKIYRLSESLVCSVAGLTSDANILVEHARSIAQRYRLVYLATIPCDYLVSSLCDIKQAYTQYGGRRPFGVSFLFAGYDPERGFQLYQSDPSGNFSSWKATCIGYNCQSAISLLKNEYTDDLTLEDSKKMAIKVMYKSVDVSKLTHEKCEMTALTKGLKPGSISIKKVPDSEIKLMITEYEKQIEEEEKAAEAEKAKSQKK